MLAAITGRRLAPSPPALHARSHLQALGHRRRCCCCCCWPGQRPLPPQHLLPDRPAGPGHPLLTHRHHPTTTRLTHMQRPGRLRGAAASPGAGVGPLVSSTHLELQLGARAWPPPAGRCTDSTGHTSDWAAVRGTIPAWHGSPGCTGKTSAPSQASPAARPARVPSAAADRLTCERVVLAPPHHGAPTGTRPGPRPSSPRAIHLAQVLGARRWVLATAGSTASCTATPSYMASRATRRSRTPRTTHGQAR